MTLTIKKRFTLPTAAEIVFDRLPVFFLLIYVTYLFTFNYALDSIEIVKTIMSLSVLIFFGVYVIFRIRRLVFDVFEKSFALFIGACVLSIFFAINPNEAAYRCVGLIFIFLTTIFIHTYLIKCNKLDEFIFILCFAGIFLAGYNLYFYGPSTYLTTLGSKRIGAEIMNVNTIGKFCSLAAIICFWYTYYKKKIYFIAPMLLCSMIALGVGSRKSVVFLIIGCCLLFILKGNARQKIKNVILMIMVLAAFVAILQTPIFGRTAERFTQFVFLFTGDAPIDHSTALRMEMIKGGFEDFLKSPLMGVGIDNTHYLARKYIGEDLYLHNTFVELLASVGLIGTLPFYFLRIYPIVKLVMPVLNHDQTAILIESLLIIYLVLDFGQVSYIGMETYLYTLAGYVKIAQLEGERRRC